LQKYDDFEDLHTDLLKIIKRYGLTNSSAGYQPPPKLVKEFPKTYFARVNEGPYNKLKHDFNTSSNKNFLELFLLVIYGFNRMWRFNKSEEFNIPVGNVDFNKNVVSALENYVSKLKDKNLEFSCDDVFTKYEKFNFKKSDFIYLDPPYLITASEYNKLWGESEELRLLELIDRIHSQGAAFALSNVTTYKGKRNSALISWMKNYRVHEINSKYINYFDNGDKISREVLVTNYG
jgi:DNA adenine methylase